MIGWLAIALQRPQRTRKKVILQRRGHPWHLHGDVTAGIFLFIFCFIYFINTMFNEGGTISYKELYFGPRKYKTNMYIFKYDKGMIKMNLEITKI